jgi:hypothetical protein
MATLAVPPLDPVVPVVPVVPAVTLAQASKAEWLAASNAGIDAYLSAGDHMATIMDITGKICMAFVVLIALAWALGVLPAAVKLFR